MILSGPDIESVSIHVSLGAQVAGCYIPKSAILCPDSAAGWTSLVLYEMETTDFGRQCCLVSHSAQGQVV